ncbi:MAG: hypothetical protein KIT46_11325 [Anaerolineales bacterium]|nr:hypothetical protein [Anaerolineales bacterium]MCW5856622.1 hypothetical protein [Anaerolineales bacterium]
MQRLQRVQILLDEQQQKYLARVSKKSGKSVSALIRELISEKMAGVKEARLAQTARELRAVYETDEELTSFSGLDAEDWHA